jgi:TolA-binding protein
VVPDARAPEPDTAPDTQPSPDLEPDTAPPDTQGAPAPAPEPRPALHPRKPPRPAPKTPPEPPTAETQELEQQASQLFHSQRYDEAAAAYKKLLGVKSKRGLAWTGLAQIAFQAKNYKQAAERAKNAARAGGGLESRLVLGDAYFKLEKYPEAKKAYSDALKIAPNNPIARQNLQLIEKRSN